MSMNQFLAEAYGTMANIGGYDSDTEKLAQANVLGEILADEGIDIDDLNADTIAKVASAMFGDDAELTKAAQEVAAEEDEEEDEDEDKKTMEEKTAEADFLGRQMAHAYVDELASIEKEAGVKERAAELGSKALGALKGAFKGERLRKGLGTLGEAKKVRAAGEAAKGMGSKSIMKSKKRLGEIAAKRLGKAKGLKSEGLKETIRGGAETGAAYGLPALGLAGAGYAAGKSKKSEAQWFEDMAEQRAIEMLKQAGVIEESEDEKIAAAVDQRAYELLVENGFIEE